MNSEHLCFAQIDMPTNNPLHEMEKAEARRQLRETPPKRSGALSPSFEREMRVLTREVVVGTIGTVIGIVLWLLPIVSRQLDVELSSWMLTAGHYAPAFITFAAVFAAAAHLALLEESEGTSNV